MEIEPLDPASAGRSVLEGVHEVVSAADRLDKPGAPPVTFETAIGRLENPQPSLGRVLRWVARRDGRVVGLAALYFPEAENSHLAILELTVHPDARRDRVGTAVLRALTPELHERTVLECWNVTKGGAGAAFGTALGFEVVDETVFQALSIGAADRSAWKVSPAAGYRLRTWQDSAPEELVASYAQARRAIADSPFGRSAYRFPRWTADRVRESEADRRRRGIDHRVVAVVQRDSGRVVGFTELQLYPHRHDLGYQGDTAVLAAHRGRGLGFCVKAAMLRRLVAERPEVEEVITSTAAANPYMVNVNLALGYRTTRETVILAQNKLARGRA
ncbi:GNAT family N-acetyltransferase [Amycolatopsis carbonis]|uniref:GNAT family N-acetyltransferase n=1 Tax=Amycolatopsis carbonis TaxID=715471 RepID=A0A9Y2ICE0_9PSEU|nr:GNAT family N-acetyltransferase [Amycolatopsis sp. 2-15]WIX77162.1 GNAT family N-acetyltransferase [Amycolatopsis sp. 2-15]